MLFHRLCGFPDNLNTFGLVSGLWNSSLALGLSVGPSVAGLLLEHVGFRMGSYFIIGIAVVLVNTVYDSLRKLERNVNGWELNTFYTHFNRAFGQFLFDFVHHRKQIYPKISEVICAKLILIVIRQNMVPWTNRFHDLISNFIKFYH